MEKEFLSNLNEAQKKVATTFDGPILVLAGAGAGKTHTMITRVAEMINNGINPRTILLLTFTNKAANEMVERARKFCGDDANLITACTYHSFCNKMLRIYGDAISIGKDFDILLPTQITDALAFVKARSKHDYSIKGFPPNKVVASIFSGMVNYDISLETILQKSRYKKYFKFVIELKNLHEEYTEYKEKNHLMDYDDLMVNYYRLLKESEIVRKRIENTYQYIMVDEYQDTNDLQSKILKEMRIDNDNLAVVGDDAQSIYGFRGANVENIINFPNDYDDCKMIQLKENYRSSNEILELANESYEKHATQGFPKRMHGQFNTGIKPIVLRPENGESEAQEVYKGILDCVENGISQDDICVISRTSNGFFKLEQLLNSNSIPYEKRGGMKFLELEEVLDMIAYFRISSNKTDELSLFRVLMKHPGLGEKYSRSICDLIGVVENPLIENKYQKYKFKSELVSLHNALINSRKISDKEPLKKFDFFVDFYVKLLERVIEISNTDESVKTEEYRILENKKENLAEMRELLKSYDSVTEFLDAMILDQSRVEEINTKKVVLTTIHSVKGLEFDTCFILDCVNGVFPRGDEWNIVESEEQEELRCFYVAVTRAKKRLYIISPKYISMRGEYSFAEVTRFLDDCEDTYDEYDSFVSTFRTE